MEPANLAEIFFMSIPGPRSVFFLDVLLYQWPWRFRTSFAPWLTRQLAAPVLHVGASVAGRVRVHRLRRSARPSPLAYTGVNCALQLPDALPLPSALRCDGSCAASARSRSATRVSAPPARTGRRVNPAARGKPKQSNALPRFTASPGYTPRPSISPMRFTAPPITRARSPIVAPCLVGGRSMPDQHSKSIAS